jgi:predicted TIM-barrel fold metal-dependent hydrolase
MSSGVKGPLPYTSPSAFTRLKRLANAILAHPTRLAGFASLPTASPAKAAQELERAVTKLGFKGAMINGHVRGRVLRRSKILGHFRMRTGTERADLFTPYYSTSRRAQACFEVFGELATPAWGFAMDTCTHFLRLVFAGLFDGFPDSRMILGHLGEQTESARDDYDQTTGDVTRVAILILTAKRSGRWSITATLGIEARSYKP